MSARYGCQREQVFDCRYSNDDLQTAQYDLQSAINDIYVFDCKEMTDAINKISATMPFTQVGVSGT